MALSTSTSTLAVGASRTFNLSPGSALTLTTLPNCRVTVTETPNTVSASGVGGNASRVHNLQLGQTVTYGPYPMGGDVLVENASTSGSVVTWIRSDSAGVGLSPTNSAAAASANVTAIQSALTAGGLVQILTPGTYYYNSALSIPDQTTLYIGPGVTMKALAASYCSFLRNSNYAASTTTVTATSTNRTITVAWTAHGKSVGDWIALQGATQSAYNGVFQVATAPDANTITVIADYTPSATTATGTILARAANVGCALIVDGTLDANYSAQTSWPSDNNDKHAVIFYNVARPKFAGKNLLNAQKYMFLGANVREVMIGDCNFNTNSDGIHFQGCIGATIGHLSGYCGDDMYAQTCGDYSQYELFRGLHDGVKIARLHGLNAGQNAIKVSGGAHRHKSIQVGSVSGYFGSSIVGCVEDTNLTATYLESLTIDTLTAAWGSTNAIQVTFTTTSCTIDQATIRNLEVFPAGTKSIFNAGGSGGVINVAYVQQANVDATGVTGASSVFSQTSSGSIGTCQMDHFKIVGNANMYGLLQDSGVTRAYFKSGSWSGGGQLIRVNTGATTTPDLYLSDCTTGNTNNPIDLRKSANVLLSNWKHAGSTAININGTGTVNLYGDMQSTNTHVAIATMTVNNTIESTVQAPVFAASYTPDLGLGCTITVGTLTAGITVNNFTNVPRKGTIVKVYFTQDGTGGWGVTWGTNYIFPTAWSNTGNTAGKKSSVTFQSDGTVLVAQGANSWY